MNRPERKWSSNSVLQNSFGLYYILMNVSCERECGDGLYVNMW